MGLLNLGNQDTKKSCLALRDSLGRTCFHLACLNNQFSIVEYFICDLKLLFLIEVHDGNGDSSLHLAAMNGSHATVDLLLQTDLRSKNMLLKARNADGLTPLELSMSRKFFKTSEILIGASETVETENNRINLLHLAASEGAHEIVELLLEKKVPVDSLDSEMRNALDLAVDKGHKEVIRVLISHQDWKKLFQHKRPDASSQQESVDIGFLRISRVFSCSENPQLNSLYEHEYWDVLYSILEKSKTDEGVFDLEVLNPPLVSINKHPLMLLVNSGQQLLIKHESTRALIHLKWAIIPRLTFYSLLVFYLLFIVFFSLYSTELTELNFANLETGSSIDAINEIWEDYDYESDFKIILVAMLFMMCAMMVFKTVLFGKFFFVVE